MERIMKKFLIIGLSAVAVIAFSLGGYETVKSISSIQYIDIIRSVKKRRGWEYIPDSLTLATIETESSFRPDAIREEPGINDASYGLMQTLFKTAQWMGYKGQPEGLFDPETSIEWGTAYHAYLFNRFEGDLDAVIHSYNEGPGNYEKGKRVPTYYGRIIARMAKWDILLASEGSMEA
jgi:soluble lytic murein transglycosylase-like protein